MQKKKKETFQVIHKYIVTVVLYLGLDEYIFLFSSVYFLLREFHKH